MKQKFCYRSLFKGTKKTHIHFSLFAHFYAAYFYLFAQGRPAADPEGEEELGEVEAAVGVEVEEGEELAGQGAAGGRGQVGGQEQGVVRLELARGDQARRTLVQEVGVPACDLLAGESCGERQRCVIAITNG